MSPWEIFLYGIAVGIAFTQAIPNTLWIVRYYRNKRSARAFGSGMKERRNCSSRLKGPFWGPCDCGLDCDALGVQEPRAVTPQEDAVLRRAVLRSAKVVSPGVTTPDGETAMNLAFDLILSREDVDQLAAFSTPDIEPTDDAVRLLIGDGHSGFGLYAASPDYPEEGAVFIRAIASVADYLLATGESLAELPPNAGVAPARKITSIAEFCAEGERLGMTAASLAEALSKRPEFADCLPGAAGVEVWRDPDTGNTTQKIQPCSVEEAARALGVNPSSNDQTKGGA